MGVFPNIKQVGALNFIRCDGCFRGVGNVFVDFLVLQSGNCPDGGNSRGKMLTIITRPSKFFLVANPRGVQTMKSCKRLKRIRLRWKILYIIHKDNANI